MKSLPNKSWDLREGTEIQSWKPDEIFPSLISEDVDSVINDMLQLFQLKKNDDTASEQPANASPADKPNKRKADVRTWALDELENIAISEPEQQPEILGVEVAQTPIAEVEKRRMIEEVKKQAEETIRAAQLAAEEMILQAQQQVDRIHQEAYESGRAKGIAELDKLVENAQLIVEQMSAWREDLVRHSDGLMLEMIQKIARLMFGEGVDLGNEVLQYNLNKVMKMAESLGDLRIYLNPQDAHILDPEWRRFQETLAAKKIQIIPSETILPGGCYVQGEMGIVDARVDTQLQAILEVLDPEQANPEDELL